MKKFIIWSLLGPILVLISYIALFHNDASQNVLFIKNTFDNIGLYLFDAFLVFLILPVSLVIMDITTGEMGLERFKRIVAISAGMTTLGFAAFQFINAIATSSAEGATVVVEVAQQITHFSQYGELEKYGLVGMLTSDASGPWNSSIFPVIILIIWLIRRKMVGLETTQLHIPMILQFVLYAQQFMFGLDLKYTLMEIILMGITGSIFIWGMVSFLMPMFRKAEIEGESALTVAQKINDNKKIKRDNAYIRFIKSLAINSFALITYNPWNIPVNLADSKVKQKRGGFGQINKGYVTLNAIQLTLAITVAMFALVTSLQFLFIQMKMSEAGAALFGAAGLTSAPEALVALAAGPYINTLLLVGSNVIDGWMSAIGQTILLGYAEIASDGAITSIPLHPAIRYLTFLSWTQGIIVWITLGIYAHSIKYTKHSSRLVIFTILGLLVSITYYFGGAWYSAQAFGYGATYAQNSSVIRILTSIITFFESNGAQQTTLFLNFVGLGALVFWWSGISQKLKAIAGGARVPNLDQASFSLHKLVKSLPIPDDQHVIIALDKGKEMDTKTKLFTNKWIDLIFVQIAALAFVLDDDAYINVYTANEKQVKQKKHLLSRKNGNYYVDKYVNREVQGDIKYTPVLERIYSEYKEELTSTHDPVLILFLTSGTGRDKKQLQSLLKKMYHIPIFVEFVAIYADTPPTEMINLINLSKNNQNCGVASLTLQEMTDATQIAEKVLEEYSEYLKFAEKKGLVDTDKST